MNVQHILKDHNLRSTIARARMLEFLVQRNASVGISEINKHFAEDFDRATIYRTIKSFQSSGIVHQVLDPVDGNLYALCSSCGVEHHSDEHVHFKCTICGNSTCIEEIHIPEVKLPKGYVLTDSNMLLEGVCPNCAN